MIRLLGILQGIIWGLLWLAAIHAQVVADPDNLAIEQVTAYSGVINAGDMLIVIQYDIDYDTLPVLAATDTFVCRFFVDGSEVNAAEIISFNDLGYGLGVCSMYFTSEDRETAGIEFENPNAENYEVRIQGKPSAFSDPPQVSTLSIVYRSAVNTTQLLLTDIADLAESLENDAAWAANGFDLITFTTGQQVLTADGEAYFGQAVPNLQIMIPDLFGSSTTSPQVFERDFSTAESDRLQTLWDSSPMGPAFDTAATAWGVSKVWVLGLMGVVIIGGCVWFAQRITGAPEFGILTVPFSFPLVTAAGLGTMTAVMFVTAIAVIGLMFSLFLRRAG